MTDFSHILDRVTIRDLLDAAGIPYRGSRCACPTHGGDNPTAFSFTESTFHCFACGANGGLIDLATELWGCSRQSAFEQLCRMAGIDPGSVSAPPSSNSRPLRARVPKKTNIEFELLQERLEALKDVQDADRRFLRMLRKAWRFKKLSDPVYTAKRCQIEYELEELDTEITHLTYNINQWRKKHGNQLKQRHAQ